MLITSFPRNFLSIGGEARLLLQILTKTTVFSVGTSGRIKKISSLIELEGYWNWLPCLDYAFFVCQHFIKKTGSVAKL